jgi:hypothetical protein
VKSYLYELHSIPLAHATDTIHACVLDLSDDSDIISEKVVVRKGLPFVDVLLRAEMPNDTPTDET